MLEREQSRQTPPIQNPVLPGFHPDPSILRVGDDYFIATSTFQWFPGVPVYHSRDLAHWRLHAHLLTRPSQLDLRGVPDSGGVFAPQISYRAGTFYLVYTIVRGNHWPFIDADNYVISAAHLQGPWSEPTYLHSVGFDPSLFHDHDGRSYLLSNEIDHRPGRVGSRGIVLWELELETGRLLDERKLILEADAEGPHLYHIGDFYYLMTAEGGTGYEHGVSVSRSRHLFGPYERDPSNPVLTSRDAPEHPLQKAGHGSLVETPDGQLLLAHLCARPLLPERKSPLGRETALQRWALSRDGWLRPQSGSRLPCTELESPLPARACAEPPPEVDDFDSASLSPLYSTLREPPHESWLSLTRKPGSLALRGRESLMSLSGQSLVAQRFRSLSFRAETRLSFEPSDYRSAAGLICYYDRSNYFYLRLSRDSQGRTLDILHADGFWNVRFPLAEPVRVQEPGPVTLAVSVQGRWVQFSYHQGERELQPIGPKLDVGELSDEQGGKFGFTGAMLGLCAQDLRRRSDWAYFDYLRHVDTPRS